MVASARDQRLDTIKTVMIMGIVFEHSMLIYGYPRKHELVWALLISWLMPLFTFISGYLFKKRQINVLMAKYLYPMVFFSGINFIVGYCFYDNYHQGFLIMGMGYAMWYLWALFWFAIITPPILKGIPINILLIIAVLLTICYQIMPMPARFVYIENMLQLRRIVGFYPFFLLGLIAKRYEILESVEIKRSRIYLCLLMTCYLLLSYYKEGFAYKSGFYLTHLAGIETISQILLSYLIIMMLCVLLITSMPKKQNLCSRYGSRTLNVYLLHMLVVFPVCWGLFKHLDNSLTMVLLNSIIACTTSFFFLSDFVERQMKRLLHNCNWKLAVSLYVCALALVNSSLIMSLFDKWRNC